LVDPDVIARKLLALNESAQHLSAHQHGLSSERLISNPMLQAAIERWSQVSIEACINIAYHLIAEQGWTPPDSARAAFEQLASHGLIAPDLAKALGRAAGMRNILVHDYVRVDRQVLVSVLSSSLEDLRAFGAIVARLITTP
jgi:uncharacterized protein YutE (UPF0331/DUF86 family)